MNFSANKTPVEVIKEGIKAHMEVLILETFNLVLLKSATKNHGKYLIS